MRAILVIAALAAVLSFVVATEVSSAKSLPRFKKTAMVSGQKISSQQISKLMVGFINKLYAQRVMKQRKKQSSKFQQLLNKKLKGINKRNADGSSVKSKKDMQKRVRKALISRRFRRFLGKYLSQERFNKEERERFRAALQRYFMHRFGAVRPRPGIVKPRPETARPGKVIPRPGRPVTGRPRRPMVKPKISAPMVDRKRMCLYAKCKN